MSPCRSPSTADLAVTLLVLAVFLLPHGGTAQVPCDRGTRVNTVILVLLGYTGNYGAPVEIRIERPRADTGIATPRLGEGRWVFELRDSIPAATLDVKPVVHGYVAHAMGVPEFEALASGCAIRVSFRLEKGWQVEVDSRPRGLRVLGRTVDPPGVPFANQTLFETPAVGQGERWELEIKVDHVERYLVEVQLGDFAGRKEVVHTNTRIRDALCSRRKRGCSGLFSSLLRARGLPEFVSVRLVSP